MPAIKYQELKRRYELDGPEKTVAHLSEALQGKQLRPADFSIKDLAEALVPDGREWVRQMDPRVANGARLAEAVGAVDTSAFANITNQLVSAAVLQGYESPMFVLSGLIPATPTRRDGEKIPGMGKLAESDVESIQPGMPYPLAGIGEDYIETPPTIKRGLIVPITKEAIFFDTTNLILKRANEVGEVVGLNKEKRLCDLLVGVTNNHKWRGTTYDTYSADGSTGHASGTVLPNDSDAGLINKLTSNELVDWTDVDAAEQLFDNIVDPSTSEPVILRAKQVIVMPAYRSAMKRIANATAIEYTQIISTGANAYSAPIKTILSNPLSNYVWYESVFAYRRLLTASVSAANARKYWFLGDIAGAFAYMENWPITVEQDDANSDAAFTRDIVMQFKASERGAAVVMDPRKIVMCTG